MWIMDRSRSTPSHTQTSHPRTISPGWSARNWRTLNVHLLIRASAKGCRSTNIGAPLGTRRAHPASIAGVTLSGDLVVTSVSGCMTNWPNVKLTGRQRTKRTGNPIAQLLDVYKRQSLLTLSSSAKTRWRASMASLIDGFRRFSQPMTRAVFEE